MLQQTRVAAVIPYYRQFVEKFPSMRALARAKSETVLGRWAGLGYYSRARNLHRAAKEIVTRHGGRVPQDYEATLALPGIGRYTAGAVLSIAFDQRQPILEANTVRLFSRLLAYPGDTATAAGQKVLWATAEAVLHATITIPQPRANSRSMAARVNS